MDQRDRLARRFEEHRDRLRRVAYRLLGSTSEAEDAVQEAWLRLQRSDASEVANLGGWFTTIVSRVSLNMLQSRKSRREESLETRFSEPASERADATNPEREAVRADSIGLALLVVLDSLTPAERIAFVLHDMFAVPFDEIAPIVSRSPAATRQLASRARRRVQGADAPDSGEARQREIVSAFLNASRNGDFDALLSLLDPEVVLRTDQTAARMGAPAQLSGAAAVAETFSGRARAVRPARVDGAAGAVWTHAGTIRMVFAFTVAAGKIVAIEMVADPHRIEQLDLVPDPVV
ncbi:MAG TPA: sigma-70 family RNA polymerase sigma factor [Actinocatenispora sp.]